MNETIYPILWTHLAELATGRYRLDEEWRTTSSLQAVASFGLCNAVWGIIPFALNVALPLPLVSPLLVERLVGQESANKLSLRFS